MRAVLSAFDTYYWNDDKNSIMSYESVENNIICSQTLEANNEHFGFSLLASAVMIKIDKKIFVNTMCIRHPFRPQMYSLIFNISQGEEQTLRI